MYVGEVLKKRRAEELLHELFGLQVHSTLSPEASRSETEALEASPPNRCQDRAAEEEDPEQDDDELADFLSQTGFWPKFRRMHGFLSSGDPDMTAR